MRPSSAYRIIPFCLPLIQTALAQVRPPDPGDCLDAIAVGDSVVVCERPPRGSGNVLEIKENPPEDQHWLEREHNSQWYTFRAPGRATLTFDIVPQDIRDDIDFLLFANAAPDICAAVAARKVLPVRSNISRNDIALGSRCGLREGALEDYVHSGVGSPYSRPLEVEGGEVLYLLVDYQERPRAGFEIHLRYSSVSPTPPPVVLAVVPQTLRLSLVDGRTGKPVTGTLSIEGMRFDSVVEVGGASTFEFHQDKYKKLTVGCVAKGYMFKTERVAASRADSVDVRIALDPIVPGAQVTLDEIRFEGNQDKVHRASQPALYLLLHFLEQNPDTRVEIQGHVNAPFTKRNAKEFIELSAARARTVRDFLMVNNVDVDRVSYAGMGNAHMLYPNPRSEAESAANRRVEVHVLGN